MQSPADLASRGFPVGSLTSSDWLKGPAWLTSPEGWPDMQANTETSELVTEMRVGVVTAELQNPWWDRLSRWTRVTGVVLRMLQWRYPTKTRAEILPIAEARLY